MLIYDVCRCVPSSPQRRLFNVEIIRSEAPQLAIWGRRFARLFSPKCGLRKGLLSVCSVFTAPQRATVEIEGFGLQTQMTYSHIKQQSPTLQIPNQNLFCASKNFNGARKLQSAPCWTSGFHSGYWALPLLEGFPDVSGIRCAVILHLDEGPCSSTL